MSAPLFAQLTWPELEATLSQGAIGLWPIGSTEAHGPHLSLATDQVIAEEMCKRAAPAIAAAHGSTALILPTLTFTVTDFARPFRGTLSLPKETMLAFVRDACLEIARQGFRAVCLVNAHLEPAHRFMLRDAVKAARAHAACPIGIADPADARFAHTVTEELASGSCHAGRYETSLVLAASPKDVREVEQRKLPSKNVDLVQAIKSGRESFLAAGLDQAYCGDPRAATREEGDATYSRLAAIVVEVVGGLLGGT